MTFLAPQLLPLLALPVLVAVLALWRHRHRSSAQRRFASPSVWWRTMGGLPATGLLRLMSWSIALALVLLALARPQWGEVEVIEEHRGRDLVIAIDVSDSMRCEDLGGASRLERSKRLLGRIMPRLEGNRLAVVTFAGEAYPMLPLTDDLDAVATFIEGIQPGVLGLGVPNITPGSNVGTALATALELLGPGEGGRVVALFTDGENLQGELDQAVDRLIEANATLLTVVAGTEAGGLIPIPNSPSRYKTDRDNRPVVTRAQPETMAKLAERSDGRAIRLDVADPETRFVEAVETLETRALEAGATTKRPDRFQIFLGAAAFFLAAGFLLSPWRKLAPGLAALLLLVAPVSAQDASNEGETEATAEAEAEATVAEVAKWQQLIPGGSRRLAREGQQAWADGDLEGALQAFEQASQLADDPSHAFDLGTAAAGLGDLQRAGSELGTAAAAGYQAAANYNLGTAALEAEELDLALGALRQALLADPSDPQIKRNFEIALRKKQQQEQEQEQDREQEQEQDEQQEEQEQDQEQQDQEQQQQQQEQEQQPQEPPPSMEALLQALERAEAEAREDLPKPERSDVDVEKDW